MKSTTTKNKIDKLIDKWKYNDVELNKVILRLILKGFTNDKNALINNITQYILSKILNFMIITFPKMKT